MVVPVVWSIERKRDNKNLPNIDSHFSKIESQQFTCCLTEVESQSLIVGRWVVSSSVFVSEMTVGLQSISSLNQSLQIPSYESMLKPPPLVAIPPGAPPFFPFHLHRQSFCTTNHDFFSSPTALMAKHPPAEENNLGQEIRANESDNKESNTESELTKLI